MLSAPSVSPGRLVPRTAPNNRPAAVMAQTVPRHAKESCCHHWSVSTDFTLARAAMRTFF